MPFAPASGRLMRTPSQDNLITKLRYKEVLDWINRLPLPHIERERVMPEALLDGTLADVNALVKHATQSGETQLLSTLVNTSYTRSPTKASLTDPLLAPLATQMSKLVKMLDCEVTTDDLPKLDPSLFPSVAASAKKADAAHTRSLKAAEALVLNKGTPSLLTMRLHLLEMGVPPVDEDGEHRHVRAPSGIVRERQRVEDVRDEVVSTDIAHVVRRRRGLDEAAQRPRGRVPERRVVVPHDRT